LFDRVVEENNALIFDPANCEERRLAEPPSQKLIERLLDSDLAELPDDPNSS